MINNKPECKYPNALKRMLKNKVFRKIYIGIKPDTDLYQIPFGIMEKILWYPTDDTGTQGEMNLTHPVVQKRWEDMGLWTEVKERN